MENKYQIKIIDYGFSKIQDQKIEKNGMWSRMGVPFTKAPEVEFDSNVAYDARIDVWGIGVAYFILVTNRLIFPKEINRNGVKRYYKEAWSLKLFNGNTPEENMHSMSLAAIKFINDLIRYDFQERPTSKEVLEHPYFKTDLSTAKQLKDVIELD